MSKSKSDKETKKAAADEKEAQPADGGWRETVESIAMAVILALLFRGFVAEAFVIPTGSMAPTLDGRHKDVQCPKCQTWYQVSGSDEQRDDRPSGLHVSTTTCPICRYTQTLDPLNKRNEGSFSGDRIIVGKFCYDFAEPQRWDVLVFKYPHNAVQNYIKRLIGLPGEKIWIVGGNIYFCRADEPESALRIARKPPHKLDVLLQLVDDTHHIAAELSSVGWPSRWQPWPKDQSGWSLEDRGRTFTCEAGDGTESWLRYRHLVPSHDDWKTIELNQQLPLGVAARLGELISDNYAYNTPHYIRSETASFWQAPLLSASYRPPTEIEQHRGPGDLPNYSIDLLQNPYLRDSQRPNFECLGQHWVDDLAVECVAEVSSAQGELSLLLVRGGVRHVCRINLADGKATLSMTNPDGSVQPFVGDDGKSAANPTAPTSVKGPGRYRLRLSNCDHEMLLWVNGSVVTFDGPTTYASDDLIAPVYSETDPGDLAPAGIASRGAAVKLSRLRIYRDKYYIATTGASTDYDKPLEPARVQEVFRDPSQWSAESSPFADKNRRHVEFVIGPNHFLPMGDNSPQSSDGRYWGYVERDLLIGKALLIYWPHTWNRPVPYTPNFSRMGRIR